MMDSELHNSCAIIIGDTSTSVRHYKVPSLLQKMLETVFNVTLNDISISKLVKFLTSIMPSQILINSLKCGILKFSIIHSNLRRSYMDKMYFIKILLFKTMSLPRVEVSIACFGLIHSTVGRRDSKSMVLAAEELCVYR